MNKLYKFGILLIFLLLSACHQGPNFTADQCQCVIKAPHITNKIIVSFAQEKITLMPVGPNLTIILPQDVFFKQNLPTLDPKHFDALNDLAKLLKRYGNVAIKVSAYTDNIGDPALNRQISHDRARSIVTYLWSQGVGAEQMYPKGYGEKNTVADNNEVDGSAANRRIEITVQAHCSACLQKLNFS